MSAEGEAAANPTLLQDLLAGAMHSRAAYGYAMAAGHLSSLLNFALLQTVRGWWLKPLAKETLKKPFKDATSPACSALRCCKGCGCWGTQPLTRDGHVSVTLCS